MIIEVSHLLEECIQNALYPHIIASKDMVSLCIPQHEHKEYQIGIYLYDIEEDTFRKERYAQIKEKKRIYPPIHMSVRFVIFCNQDTQFGGYSKDREAVLLKHIIQIMHDTSSLELHDQLVSLQFEQLPLEHKIRLWQSFSKPLQPAIYVVVSPITISSLKEEEIYPVYDVHIDSKQKE